MTPTQAQLDRFARLSGDANPIHVDPDFAARSAFGRTVAHGAMLTTWALALGDDPQPATSAVRFAAPAYAGEPLEAVAQPDGRRLLQRVSDGQPVCVPEAMAPAPPVPPGAAGAPALPLRPGMCAAGTTRLLPEAAAGLADIMPPELALPQPLAFRALVLGGWSALLGMTLPGAGTNYLKQQSRWLDLRVGDSITLAVTVAGLRPDLKLVDLRTTATGPRGLAAEGRALVSARDVAGAWD